MPKRSVIANCSKWLKIGALKLEDMNREVLGPTREVSNGLDSRRPTGRLETEGMSLDEPRIEIGVELPRVTREKRADPEFDRSSIPGNSHSCITANLLRGTSILVESGDAKLLHAEVER